MAVGWKPSEHMDAEMRRWMESRGWPVTETDYHFDQEIYSWRHELRGGPSPTIRIERYVLEHYPPFIVAHHLDTLRVAAAIQADPRRRLVVRQKGTAVVLEEVPA